MDRSLDEIIKSKKIVIVKKDKFKVLRATKKIKTQKRYSEPILKSNNSKKALKFLKLNEHGTASHVNKSVSLKMKPEYKINISNLHFKVTDNDMKELFDEFGHVIRAVVNYNKNGQSLGTAVVSFNNKSSAFAAQNKYHGVPLDFRPMHITVMNDEELFNQVKSVPKFPNNQKFNSQTKSNLPTKRNSTFTPKPNLHKSKSVLNVSNPTVGTTKHVDVKLQACPQPKRNFTNTTTSNSNKRKSDLNVSKEAVPTTEQLDADLDEYFSNNKS